MTKRDLISNAAPLFVAFWTVSCTVALLLLFLRLVDRAKSPSTVPVTAGTP